METEGSAGNAGLFLWLGNLEHTPQSGINIADAGRRKWINAVWQDTGSSGSLQTALHSGFCQPVCFTALNQMMY